ncbi:hypothetical protein LGM90_14580 [Burkholderia sp. AU28942]|uniref:hypothetical protein n=1 Tax=Burkholderia TaxID=32008 RepID=UPI000B06141A|nr:MULTISPECIES: hypothetical protein [Burkholderia]MBR7960286.1 hypothetical protein [Burkholderia vietnamiensis]MBY4696255.1 hypothetical protein [Burkholderia latens]MCA8309737.1 hypothetical protein [Burkholderia sp. AU28942]QTO51096.1 hypothetical protein J8I86_16745 [Burkholderia latens]
MKAGARDRLADMSPGFCLKNIGTKLLQKFRCLCRRGTLPRHARPAGTRQPA